MKWELYFKSYGVSAVQLSVPHLAGMLTGCVMRVWMNPSHRSVVVNAAIAAFFALLWVAVFVRVRRVPVVAPTGSGSDL